jgi:hypothetical protein
MYCLSFAATLTAFPPHRPPPNHSVKRTCLRQAAYLKR